MFSGAICEAQNARVVEALPDGSYVIEIEGQGEFRALNAAKIRELQKRKVDLDALTKIDAEKDKQLSAQAQEITLLKKDVEIVGLQRDSFKADFERSQEDSKRNFSLFMSERALRVEGQQFIPHGKASGFGGKMLAFLDSGYGQSLFKLVIPTAQAIKVFSTKCP